MIQKIIGTLDKRDLALGVFVDLQKAFDTVDHSILLKKLYHYGINLFRSYLTGWSQYVTANGVSSNTAEVLYGFPKVLS